MTKTSFLLAGIPVSAQDLGRWRFYTTLQLDTTAAGANVAGDVAKFPLAVALNANSLDFSQAKPDGGIGNQSQFPQRGRQWDGLLDEARFLNVVKDDHWIKLDYESQRDGQKLVTFGKPQARGFAFVEMANDAEGQRAIAALNGRDLDGRALTINEARPKEARSGGGGSRQNSRW